ncbi:MAG TPA: squalene/phytoene synthase family protein [Hyphomicrobiaceae bacterium]|nr:squalene/phytoene synthase family protein [Hyphomicrobiaceae bacterium]
MAKATHPSSAELVRERAREGEIDRYLAATRSPAAARADLITLAAFAAEIARIPATVREPMMGAIRLQWWRDAIALPAGEASGHPVANAIRETITRHRLPPALLIGTIDAREGDVTGNLLPDARSRRAWLAKREGALFELAWRILGLPPSTEADEACADAGHAYGLARALSHLPAAIQHGGLLLSGEELSAAGVDVERLTSADAAAQLEPLIEALRVEAERAVGRARELIRQLPRGAALALLPAASVTGYLAAQRRGPRPSLHAITEPLPLARVTRIWLASVTGRL